MKLGGAAPTPTPADNPSIPSAPAEENPVDVAPVDTAQAPDSGSNEMPFEKQPFDAGVDADEETDPKKFIEQLTGKLGQSLRKYEETQGQPDFDLEKFTINSVLSATHTAEMDPKDQKDIIKKVKNSGVGDDENTPEEPENNDNVPDDGSSADNDTEFSGDAGDAEEAPMNEMSLNDTNVQKLIKIYDNGSDEVRAILGRLVSFSEKISKEDFIKDLQDEIDYEDVTYIFKKLKELGIQVPDEDVQTEGLFLKNPPKNNMFQEGSNDILQEKSPCWDGYKQVGMKEKDGKQVPNCVKINENLNSSRKNGIFAKAKIKSILKESFNQDDMSQPVKEPVVKPATPQTKPQPKPSRKNRPFLPQITPGIKTQPKALDEIKHDYEVYHKTFSSAVQTAKSYAEGFGYVIPEEEWWQRIASGPRKPSNGQTNRYSLELLKNEKPQKKHLNIQVYNTGSSYELNCYIQ